MILWLDYNYAYYQYIAVIFMDENTYFTQW